MFSYHWLLLIIIDYHRMTWAPAWEMALQEPTPAVNGLFSSAPHDRSSKRSVSWKHPLLCIVEGTMNIHRYIDIYQYQFVSPDDWSNPWNMPVEKIKIDLIWEVIAYIDVVMVRGLNKEGVSGKLWVVIANWKSIHNQYSIIFQFLHDKLFWQKITFL